MVNIIMKKSKEKFDDARTEWLAEHQYKLLRFTNNKVLNELPTVLQEISDSLISGENKAADGSPSPLERELEGEVFLRETNTMPGYAGSSWYFLRYMDPHDDKTFCDKKASDYWNQVDVYVGGTEHAVGHLLYSRMWTKFLYDLNLISFNEPYKKLLNQGMIQGSSRFVYRLMKSGNYVSKNILDKILDFNNVDEEIVDLRNANIIKKEDNSVWVEGQIAIQPLRSM